jgi:hypothetical protein
MELKEILSEHVIGYGIGINKQTDGNGSIICKYVKDGIVQPFADIVSGKGRKAGKFQLIVKDLELVENNLIFIKNTPFLNVQSDHSSDKLKLPNQELIHLNCMAISIVTYAKCFTEAKSRGTSLHAKEHIYEPLPQFRDTHDFLMHIRHEFFSHAGNANIENSCTRIIYHEGGQFPLAHADYNFSLSEEFIELFILLIRSLKKNIKEKVLKLINSEHKRILKVKSENVEIKREYTRNMLTWESWKLNKN